MTFLKVEMFLNKGALEFVSPIQNFAAKERAKQTRNDDGQTDEASVHILALNSIIMKITFIFY